MMLGREIPQTLERGRKRYHLERQVTSFGQLFCHMIKTIFFPLSEIRNARTWTANQSELHVAVSTRLQHHVVLRSHYQHMTALTTSYSKCVVIRGT